MSELVAPLKKYVHSGEINFKIKNQAGALEAVKNKYASEAIESVQIDGLWYRFDWGWVNVRTNNTGESLVRLNLETPTAEMTAEKVGEFSALLAGFAD